MRQLENQTGIKVKYTNLSDYFSAVTSSDVAWPTNFGGDFFPLYEYNIYWTVCTEDRRDEKPAGEVKGSGRSDKRREK